MAVRLLSLFAIARVVVGTFPIHPPNNNGLQDLFTNILSVPIAFADDLEESNCNTIYESLSSEEQQIAARTSYAYWYLEEYTDTQLSSEQQRQSAMREARRHLLACDGDVNKTIDRLHTVCQYRKDHQVDLFRVAFFDELSNNQNCTDKSQLATQMRQLVRADMERQAVVMKGTDLQSRSIMIKFPRRSGGTTEKEYLMAQLYIAERANAVIEYVSQGRQDTMVAIFDFSEMRSSYSPSLKWQIEAVRTVQLLYPEKLYKLIVLEPPLWIRGLYLSIRPFLSKKTTQKLQIVSDRSKLCGEILGCDDGIVSALFQDEVNLDHYLKGIPFFCPHDCEQYGYTSSFSTTQ